MSEKFDPTVMNLAADKAAKELSVTWSAQEVAIWWSKWYRQAGHKRLARILMSAFGQS